VLEVLLYSCCRASATEQMTYPLPQPTSKHLHTAKVIRCARAGCVVSVGIGDALIQHATDASIPKASCKVCVCMAGSTQGCSQLKLEAGAEGAKG
jgi:hypothetical protein